MEYCQTDCCPYRQQVDERGITTLHYTNGCPHQLRHLCSSSVSVPIIRLVMIYNGILQCSTNERTNERTNQPTNTAHLRSTDGGA